MFKVRWPATVFNGYFVIAPLRMVIMRRNVSGWFYWLYNVLTNWCVCLEQLSIDWKNARCWALRDYLNRNFKNVNVIIVFNRWPKWQAVTAVFEQYFSQLFSEALQSDILPSCDYCVDKRQTPNAVNTALEIDKSLCLFEGDLQFVQVIFSSTGQRADPSGRAV